MARKMATRDSCATRKPAAENIAATKSGSDQDTKKKRSYKAAHSIGSRKVTEKVVTYSETLRYFPEMVQQYLIDRDMEPKKASPAKSPAGTTTLPKSTPKRKVHNPSQRAQIKLSPVRSVAKSSPVNSPSKKPPAAKSPSRSHLSSSASSKSSPVKTSSSKSPGKTSSPPKSTSSESPLVKTGIKHKLNTDSPAAKEDVSPTKKAKSDPKIKNFPAKRDARAGQTDCKMSVAEKLKKLSAKTQSASSIITKKKSVGNNKQVVSDNIKKNKKTDSRSQSGDRGKSPSSKKMDKSKISKKKKEEKEIPSLLSFIKPKREASLNANVLMDIMFEKPQAASPKKSPPKSLTEISPDKTPTAQVDNSPKSAKKKLVFDRDIDSKSPKAKKKKKPEESPLVNGQHSPCKVKTVKKNSSKKRELAKLASVKVVKRKTKKRMASLNARALIVAERESMQMVLERAARTDRYCVSWVREVPPTSHSPHRSVRWVDGLGNCNVCNSKKDLVVEAVGVPEVTAPALALTEAKLPVTVLPGVLHDKDHAADDRPSSVVDVVTAHTPHVDVVSAHQPSHVIDMVSPHSPLKAQVLGGSFGSFGGLFGHSPPCVLPCPGYSYSHTEGYVTTSASYQSFTLSGMGSLNAVPLMTPTFRPSAFSVPGYNVNLPYGYYPTGPYYPPAPSALLPHTLPEPCMLPHHVPIKVPHAQVRVLIHNPDTPQDLAAFSEHRSSCKGDPTAFSLIGKIANDNNNNNGSIRNNSMSRSNGVINHSSQMANGKRSSEKSVEKSGSKSEGTRKKELNELKKDCENKKRDADSKKRENESSKKKDSENKSIKNGDSSLKLAGENNQKKESDLNKKKDSRIILKTKEGKSIKGLTKEPKKKNDKKKKTEEKEVAGSQTIEACETKEETIPEHGWVWVGEPETKKVVSVHMDRPSEERQCYKAIRHTTHGDVIHVRDCVLLRSGCIKSDVPYVAKVGAFWEHPKTKEMMMSLLWYYQPEHTEAGRQPHDMDNEVFASRHRDENSVACIDDKCYVLTFDQYCRYQAEMRRTDQRAIPRAHIVPDLNWSDPDIELTRRELPGEDVDPSNIFCCRKVYDFRMKRILKNPT